MLLNMRKKQALTPRQSSLEQLCDIFQGLEELHYIVGTKVREMPIEFELQQRFISHLEFMRRELDTCKFLCIKSRLRAICTG